MEYMACGKPIAMTRMKAHTDVVPEGSAGISYFDNVTPKEIAEAIEKVILNRDEWHSKKDVMVNHARSKYSYKVLAAELLKYYKIISSEKMRNELAAHKRFRSLNEHTHIRKKKNVDFVAYVRVQDVGKKFYLTSERELIRSLNNINVKSELIAFGKGNEPEFVKLINAPFNNPTLVKIKIMAYLLKFRKKKAILIFGKLAYLTSIPLILFRKLFGSKYKLMFDLRSIPVETTNKTNFRKFKNALLFVYYFFDGATFITEETKKVCELYIGKKFKRYEIYPSGFNNELMKSAVKSSEMLGALGISADDIIVFYHGSLSKNRGVIELAQAVEILKKKYNVRFFVIGAGDEDIIKTIKNGNRNIFLEPVLYSEIPKFISIADICVSPLPDILWWRIASALKVMEYMACGKPIAMTRMKAHTDVVPEGSAGISYFDRVSPESIADAIEVIIKDKDKFNREAKKLQIHAIKNYTYDSIAKKVLEFYEGFYEC